MLVEDLHERARAIRVVGFDVDGVCTDGKLYYGPNGEALHAFQARDGLGIVLAGQSGRVLAAVSGRISAHVAARMSELRVPHILQGVGRKDEAMAELLSQIGATWDETAYIGDDVNDLPAMRRARLAACVPEAADGVARHAHYVTTRRGGEGALRELLELIMKARGEWSFG
jgi:3-deoxy-D-manno-octulosonate 8-phosphate phosphatase (KDO 8-P phosphatase)